MPALDTSAVAIRRDAAELPEEDVTHSDYGWVMFFVFTAAVLAISFAVAALALVPTWWMLGIVFGVHLAVTAVTTKVVLGAFEQGSDADAPAVQAAAPTTRVPRVSDLAGPGVPLAHSR
ncbi:MAG TPA: hypothetical protein VFN65_10465 [Solirubrobacteraceae bacterium]|nr:hypothetical protein [Solirubrobacteraceae bacterium]